jgi:hypothetical protein
VPHNYLTVRGEGYNINRPQFRKNQIKNKDRRTTVWKKL